MNALIGLEKPLRFLDLALAAGRLGHFYILIGPRGCGKTALANYFMQRVYCQQGKDTPCDSCATCKKILSGNHPDVHVLRREEGKQDLSVSVMQELHQILQYRCVGGGYRFIHIQEGDCLNLSAMNAILKVLEEPPPNTVLLLEISRRQSVLPTILSRGQMIVVPALTQAQIEEYLQRHGFDTDRIHVAVQLCGGSLGEAVELAQNKDMDFIHPLSTRLSQCTPLESVDLAVEIKDWVQGVNQIESREKFLRILDFLSREWKMRFLEARPAGPEWETAQRVLESLEHTTDYLQANGQTDLAIDAMLCEILKSEL